MTETEKRAPVEFRAAAVADVDHRQRIITLVAVPYESPADVVYRNEMWRELFTRGAFDGIETRSSRVTVNRDHDKSRTVGKAIKFDTSATEGLVAELRVAPTQLGDETLILADPSEDALRASVGFGVRGSDQILNRSTMTRTIKRAFLDHIALVETPAYAETPVLSVRETQVLAPATRLVTPLLDEEIAWLEAARARRRARRGL